MVAEGYDPKLIIFNSVNQPVLFVDSPRPISGEFVPEWLWLSDAGKGISFGIFYQPSNSLRDSSIFINPVGEIFPSLV